MIRESLLKKEAGLQNGFRMRGLGEVSRIEALSDGVIAFAITLLVVSLEVPKTFDELMVTMRGFVAFAITFAALFHIWLIQYRFFRRYGLNDNFVVWMTAALLFVILFYVYPLKFVCTFVINNLAGVRTAVVSPDGTTVPAVRGGQVPTMMVMVGIGYSAVFTVFTLLYRHAYRKRAALGLNELEVYDTRHGLQENALMAAVGLLSVCIAAFAGPRWFSLSWLVYWLIGPIQFLHGWTMGRRRRRIEEKIARE
ncbi:MAG TPA: TMEM175 family protein [Pyrinomonadaceae bacterium]|nr:TMEM175 family protein [Pyrinomonadaceae bacterium]